MFQALFFSLSLVLLSSHGLQAAIPAWAFSGDQIDKAQATAREKSQPLAFVFTDTSAAIIKKLNRRCFTALKGEATVVVMYGRVEKQWQQISPLLIEVLDSKKLSTWAPRVVVTTWDMAGIWAMVSRDRIEDDGEFRKFKDKLKTIKQEGSKADYHRSAELYWRKHNHSRVIGSFVSLQEGILTTKHKDKEYQNAIDLFLPADVAYAKSLARLDRKPEAWSNPQGKVITGTFISMVDGNITLELENGKEMSFPVSRLSEDSQKRAQERAAE